MDLSFQLFHCALGAFSPVFSPFAVCLRPVLRECDDGHCLQGIPSLWASQALCIALPPPGRQLQEHFRRAPENFCWAKSSTKWGRTLAGPDITAREAFVMPASLRVA